MALLTPVLCECISLAAQVAISILFLDSYCNCSAFVSDSILVPPIKLFSSMCYFQSVPLNPVKASASVVLNILYQRTRQRHVKQINFLWFCTDGPCLLLNTKISMFLNKAFVFYLVLLWRIQSPTKLENTAVLNGVSAAFYYFFLVISRYKICFPKY